MYDKNTHAEVKSLIKCLESASYEYDRKLREYTELRATISHWLFDDKLHFRSRSADLVRLWEAKKLQYIQDLKLAHPELANTLEAAFSSRSNSSFTFIDLFAGIGGFRLALEGNGGHCVFSSEWDKGAKETYFANHLEIPFGDINQFTDRNVTTDEQLGALIPDHDILAAGFPCQPFSRAGVSARESLGQSHGFECETQGTLFYSIARTAFVKQPKILFLENVRNIVSHNKGGTFKTIKETLENLGDESEHKFGYRFISKIINAETVVPQKRVRCYMVCVRKDILEESKFGEFEFPSFEGTPLPLNGALSKELSAEEEANYTISDRLWAGHKKRSKRNIDRGAGFVAFEAKLDRPANTIVARYGKDGKECLIPQKGKNPRLLTIEECRRIFGYPDAFYLPIARTPAYKQLGNSVVVPVIEKIASAFLDQYNIRKTLMATEDLPPYLAVVG